MLKFTVDELVNKSIIEIANRIENEGGTFQLELNVESLYQAASPVEIARNWLKVWYTAEVLADNSITAKCDYREGPHGLGIFQFHLSTDNYCKMSEALISFASAYDENDLESMCFIHDEADEWLEKKYSKPAWFPNLEQHYQDDAEQAAEWQLHNPEEEE